jgi:mono/diheme cytochrome c family protein
MKRTIVAAIAGAFAAASFAVAAQAPAGDAARGKDHFMKGMCYTCHGTAGLGSRYGPQLAPHPLPWEAFAHQVRQPRASMPRYVPQTLSEQDLADIYAYVVSVKPGPKAGAIPLLKD